MLGGPPSTPGWRQLLPLEAARIGPCLPSASDLTLRFAKQPWIHVRVRRTMVIGKMLQSLFRWLRKHPELSRRCRLSRYEGGVPSLVQAWKRLQATCKASESRERIELETRNCVSGPPAGAAGCLCCLEPGCFRALASNYGRSQKNGA